MTISSEPSFGQRLTSSCAWVAGLLVLGLFYFPVYPAAFGSGPGNTFKGAMVLVLAVVAHFLVMVLGRRAMPVWAGALLGLMCGALILALTLGLVFTLPIIAVEVNSNSARLTATLVPWVVYGGALLFGALCSIVSTPLGVDARKKAI